MNGIISSMRGSTLLLGLATLAICGCKGGGGGNTVSAGSELPKPMPVSELKGDGVELLSKIADRYQSLKSYSATISWRMETNGRDTITSERLFFYEAPNKFRAEAVTGSMKFTSVSDGKSILEFTGNQGQFDWVPPRMDQQRTSIATGFQLAGSLSTNLFSGSKYLINWIDPSMDIERVKETENGTVRVRFKAKGSWGTTDFIADEKSLLLKSVKYQFEPFIDELNASKPQEEMRSMNVIESFANVKTDSNINPATFSTKAPDGMKVVDNRTKSETGDEIAIQPGFDAPNISLKQLQGGQFDLSEHKGNVVLLDFWATWCVPCKKTLPLTFELGKKYAGKGLVVGAISNEDPELIKVFLKQERLEGLNVLLDTDKNVGQTYQASAIPMFVVIDKEGKISYVHAGELGIQELYRALEDAGLKL
ncbi:MAG: redoxin domain-containing protein [Armatimonadetes bacterium]|nr:redoxin domain-containing protein [Armatimonadota bacterium]